MSSKSEMMAGIRSLSYKCYLLAVIYVETKFIRLLMILRKTIIKHCIAVISSTTSFTIAIITVICF